MLVPWKVTRKHLGGIGHRLRAHPATVQREHPLGQRHGVAAGRDEQQPAHRIARAVQKPIELGRLGRRILGRQLGQKRGQRVGVGSVRSQPIGDGSRLDDERQLRGPLERADRDARLVVGERG
ncbi:MAG TPA: hypothetical protein PKK15_05665, partial [Kouleothrix sp.]|nr:hypothetical protein [Kouleothrix sp.]